MGAAAVIVAAAVAFAATAGDQPAPSAVESVMSARDSR
jgi:hypothetical protein